MEAFIESGLRGIPHSYMKTIDQNRLSHGDCLICLSYDACSHAQDDFWVVEADLTHSARHHFSLVCAHRLDTV